MSLREKLTEALTKKQNDINSFIWKGEKIKVGNKWEQESIKMVDCSVEKLKSFLDRCDTMLYNTNSETPGRYVLLDIISKQRDCCNTELFLRWLDSEKQIPRYVFITSLQDFLNHNQDLDKSVTPIDSIVDGCPAEFGNITIENVINGCLDMLGQYSRKHLTLSFILNQGIWFSQSELEEMSKLRISDRVAYAEQYLDLRSKIKSNSDQPLFRITPKGLSLAQMHAMVTLHSKKYSELSDLQLETLRNRILFSLENEVRFHIKQWENRKKQIKLVLQSKGVNID